MAKFFDENGNEVEGFTAEELESKKKEAIDAFLKENPSKADELKTAQDALKVANDKIAELEKNGGNQHQKERLIKERDDATKAVEELKNTFSSEIKSLRDTFFGSTKNKALKALSGGDAELEKKILLEYDGFAGEPKSDEEIQQRMAKAFTIAKGVPPAPNFMDGAGSGGQRGEHVPHKPGEGAPTEGQKFLGKQFGISEEEAKKYGGEGQK